MLNQKLMGKTGEEKQFVEDLFSVHLYTGNGSTQTINNGIDLAGKGGLVWIKPRNANSAHGLFDTKRGRAYSLISNSTTAQLTSSAGYDLTSFNSTGFSVGPVEQIYVNNASQTYASWTFRKAPKFFDVVTWTSDGTAQTINHSLGITPGMIIVKCTSGVDNWWVWHNTLTNSLQLNTSSAVLAYPVIGSVTSSSFSALLSGLGTNGATYVAYLFAHDTTTDGLIQCGSFTGPATVNLGWEPQYILFKRTDGVQDWYVMDTMRGIGASGDYSYLNPNTSNAEGSASGGPTISATGFTWPYAGASYIYMAIRRGPMKTPTDGSKVFKPIARTGTSAVATTNAGFAPDSVIIGNRDGNSGYGAVIWDKIRGAGKQLRTAYTSAEATASDSVTGFNNTGINLGADTANYSANWSSATYIDWNFQRAPGFFDVVCYTGTGSAATQSHNLGVAPEMMIVKNRSSTPNWAVYHTGSTAGGTPATSSVFLNLTNASADNSTLFWNGVAPSATNISLGANVTTNGSGSNYVAYLFASCPGVSKVGSYSGTGANTTHNIDCGFTAGARFVLIKRTNATGNWYVFDTARGITSGNDTFLALNTTNPENSGYDCITPYSAGFNINDASNVGLNETGGEYIYLAIA